MSKNLKGQAVETMKRKEQEVRGSREGTVWNRLNKGNSKECQEEKKKYGRGG